jgi:hypothetical protein
MSRIGAVTAAAYRYVKKLPPAEAVLKLEIHDRRGLRANLKALARVAGHRYGFVVDQAPTSNQHGTVRHLMMVWDGPVEVALLRSISARLGHDIDTASVALAYPNEQESAQSLSIIEGFKRATSDRLNVIRPDRDTGSSLFVSNYKLIQTMIAETVRVRYRPVQVSDRLPPGVQERARPFFQAACARIADNAMWSRGPSDGCVALRVPEGVVVTATQTSKAPLELDRLVLVHSYDEATDSVHYSGPALPSADCVELMVLARQRPDLRAFVHTHASRLITRNTWYSGGLRVGIRVSGEPALGHELARLLPHAASTLVVLEEHGELFAGACGDDAFFRWFDSVCDDAGHTLTLRSTAPLRATTGPTDLV